MKNFRTLDQAKKDLQEIHQYVKLIENYQPQDFTQKVIYTYALVGSIVKTAETLNSQGYLVNKRTIEPQNITNIITSSPAKNDLLHKQIKQLYLKKTLPRRNRSKNQ